MQGDPKDRRQYPRVFLSKDENFHGALQIPGMEDAKVHAGILNISEGGVCIFFKRIPGVKIRKGDRLQLREIQGKPSILAEADLIVEVKWIVDNAAFENLELGCEILNAPDSIISEIRAFVSKRMK